MCINFIVITPWIGLISKKDNLLVVCEETKAVGLIPSDRENIKANLPSDGILDTKVREFCNKFVDELLTNLVLEVILLELFSFWLWAVSANGRNVNESSSIFDEGSSLYRDIQIRDVMETVVNKLFELLLS